ncbi:hypothetical protein ACJMK2_012563 [Sinanodonta woodiana]|uniref:Uncharacterized protein n=1 Tax=Sinanodonta woodiana TaxID=1069815 RepID=A0ABD3VBJ0_SINWO
MPLIANNIGFEVSFLIRLFNPKLAGGHVAVHSKRSTLRLTKPICVGLCVIDLSKLFMHELYYDKIKPFYQDRVKVLYAYHNHNVYGDFEYHVCSSF